MNNRVRNLSLGRRERGVTLVEILVTVLVMSVGLLGIAALQTVSLRDTNSSVVRSQATSLADYILDRMRANRSKVADYEIAKGATKAGTDRASSDVIDWKALLAANNADGSIAREDKVVVVTIFWNERETTRDSANPGVAALSFVTRSEI